MGRVLKRGAGKVWMGGRRFFSVVSANALIAVGCFSSQVWKWGGDVYVGRGRLISGWGQHLLLVIPDLVRERSDRRVSGIHAVTNAPRTRAKPGAGTSRSPIPCSERVPLRKCSGMGSRHSPLPAVAHEVRNDGASRGVPNTSKGAWRDRPVLVPSLAAPYAEDEWRDLSVRHSRPREGVERPPRIQTGRAPACRAAFPRPGAACDGRASSAASTTRRGLTNRPRHARSCPRDSETRRRGKAARIRCSGRFQVWPAFFEVLLCCVPYTCWDKKVSVKKRDPQGYCALIASISCPSQAAYS